MSWQAGAGKMQQNAELLVTTAGAGKTQQNADFIGTVGWGRKNAAERRYSFDNGNTQSSQG